MAVTADWMPTLADLCGIELNKDDLDGKSLVPILKNENFTYFPSKFAFTKLANVFAIQNLGSVFCYPDFQVVLLTRH